MDTKHQRQLRGFGIRLLAYGAILSLLAGLGHWYVTQPLFFKKLPYRAEALLQRSGVRCSARAPAELEALLKEVSLPYFSLTGEVHYIDETGKGHRCRVLENPENSRPVYRFASLTKVVTAAAILDLVREGRLELKSDLLGFFPEVDSSALRDSRVKKITIRHLLSHSSGFGGLFGSDQMNERGEKPWCPYDFTEIENIRLAGIPGSDHAYSNVAYCVLGEIISRTTGSSYRDYIREHYLTEYPSLEFVDGAFHANEPSYDFSNDYRLGRDYIDWLDLQALSSSAGLMGRPDEFARMIWQLNKSLSGQMLEGVLEEKCQGNSGDCYSYPLRIFRSREGAVPVGLQRGYLPGVTSALALNTRGEVLVWVAAGAKLNNRANKLVNQRIIRFLSRDRQSHESL